MTGHKTNRTAVYGPVCPVVWEGSGRKTRPYPDPLREQGVRPREGNWSPEGAEDKHDHNELD